jgi:hypothetical protein
VFARHSRALYFAFLALRLRVCGDVQSREVLILLPRFAACVYCCFLRTDLSCEGVSNKAWLYAGFDGQQFFFGVAHVRICLEVEGRFQPGCLSMICVHLSAATGCCFQILVLYLKFWFFFLLNLHAWCFCEWSPR